MKLLIFGNSPVEQRVLFFDQFLRNWLEKRREGKRLRQDTRENSTSFMPIVTGGSMERRNMSCYLYYPLDTEESFLYHSSNTFVLLE